MSSMTIAVRVLILVEIVTMMKINSKHSRG